MLHSVTVLYYVNMLYDVIIFEKKRWFWFSFPAKFTSHPMQVMPSDEELQRKAQMRPQMETFRETLVEAEIRISDSVRGEKNRNFRWQWGHEAMKNHGNSIQQ